MGKSELILCKYLFPILLGCYASCYATSYSTSSLHSYHDLQLKLNYVTNFGPIALWVKALQIW